MSQELMNFGLQRRTDLALSALRCLTRDGAPIPGPRLAESIGTTTSFLPQVMSPLIRAGWVTSERGPGGGYRLTEQSGTVTLLDVVEATEGPAETGRCVLRDAPCPGDPVCAVHAVWTQARHVLVEGFRTIPAVSTQGGPR
ncbi:MAG: RrF2 family transcriptional regulator [Actinomycetota bacterium]